jgi:pyruvate/2-oxoglutarate dehydrogenase complex dihydrolipoamide acyltransferase (E2) component
MGKHMTDIIVAPELWACSILPKGFIERWLVPNGAIVMSGDPVAEVRIEDALHELKADSIGRLAIDLRANAVVEPGSIIGHVHPLDPA